LTLPLKGKQERYIYFSELAPIFLNFPLMQNASLALEDPDAAADATLKQASLDLQWAALEDPSKLPLTHQLRLTEHAFKVAEIWGELDEWEAADAALGRGLALASALSAAATAPSAISAENAAGEAGAPHSTQERCAVVYFNSLLLRLRASVRLGQEVRHYRLEESFSLIYYF
jgi:hypothetical protein